jgi:hypothetical protein
MQVRYVSKECIRKCACKECITYERNAIKDVSVRKASKYVSVSNASKDALERMQLKSIPVANAYKNVSGRKATKDVFSKNDQQMCM